LSAGAEDLSRQARTLAQAHPLTPLASSFVNRSVEEQKAAQPSPEVATWAGACLINGYCLRRVEEVEAGLVLEVQEGAGADVDRLGDDAARIAADMRRGDGPGPFLIDDEEVVTALDRIIESEVSRRLDNLRNALDSAAAAEIEEFLTFFTVQGYALRVAERAAGALA
jgi:hypothetical protein